jgi:hypothetical protein
MLGSVLAGIAVDHDILAQRGLGLEREFDRQPTANDERLRQELCTPRSHANGVRTWGNVVEPEGAVCAACCPRDCGPKRIRDRYLGGSDRLPQGISNNPMDARNLELSRGDGWYEQK